MPRPLVGLLRGLVVALLLCAPLAATAAPSPQSDASPTYLPGQVLVRFRADAPPAEVGRVLASYTIARETGGLYRLDVAPGEEATVVAVLRGDPLVEYAIRDQLLSVKLPPAFERQAAARQRAARNDDAPLAAEVVVAADTATPTATASAAETATATPTATLPALATATPTATPTATLPTLASATPTATRTATETLTALATATPTATPTATATLPVLPTATAPAPEISSLWISDTRLGPSPSGSPQAAGQCQGLRFNARTMVNINIRYANLPRQDVRARLFSLGFNQYSQEVLGAIPSSLVSLSASGTASWPINTQGLPVGCYEVQIATAEGGVRPPSPVRFQIVTAPLQDSFYVRNLWQLDHTRSLGGLKTADIKASGAWNVTTGDSSTTIAVIGTGIDPTNPEFAGRLAPGWDFVYGKADASDDFGYGTFLSGLIIANARNASVLCEDRCGVVGVNWGAKLMPLKVSAMLPKPGGGREFYSSFGALLDAMQYARTHGARVIFVTLPVDANTLEAETERALRTEVSQATSAGALVVAPVGDINLGLGPDARLLPAAIPGWLVLAVTATDENDSHWADAYAGDYVDLAAPGRTQFYSANMPNSEWCPGCLDPDYADGDTAVAAAQVAGAAALVWSVNPNLSPLEVQARLKATADKVDTANHPYIDAGDGTLRNDWVGTGRLNIEKALWNTAHDLRGAFRTQGITTSTTGRQCTRLENVRTAATTWTVRVDPADDDWADVYGPFAKIGSQLIPDYQGDMPSYADVCVTLGNGVGQRPIGNYYKLRLIVRSSMPQAVIRELPVDVPVDTMPARLFLPLLQDGSPPPTP